ncbi:tRNA (adenosine(37)-N6)-dimethylallyltransferase MiaA [Flavitalea sp. BT771]|uniref:tRNA (adenosine(37)-N6)-dimethylallyltransferase MiaA n=1 Tax=Flavitalea sp. BT771 TaxID=3063329 RepID=UPI0026E32107|nr:tRNA (adenosine(37)-N6)-dimethylallyltransferase MiaA [Flavitalea sp. BT771]MDO6430205.1 tRNA (adenosine(37)-N6)-dimethylallyltransferase MiaA [Flavitalea sp. BT771]MDV6219656.1 tRNA (adenosine(37)-N6)-dimethylallyltransferase MiaA [Flavitalea sp. BT771]
MNEPTVIIIAGPTAVGKTAVAVRLAQQLSTKIISADSRQCFKELNIGVAKPSPEELQAVHHYFISSHSIHEEVTAASFEALALQWTDDIFNEQTKAGKPPVAVMVGGTGLYIKAFTEGLDTIPSIDPFVRQEIQQQYAAAGMDWLQQQVKEADPAFFQAGEIQNPQRLMRALEVIRSTGRSILDFRTRNRKPRPFNIKTIGLQLPRETLNQRINHRVDMMMDQGLLDEVKALEPYKHLNALQTVGYTELFEYLEGKTSLDEAIENIKVNTRRYAKRQMTWFRKDPSIRWIDAGEGVSKDNLTLILS